MTLAEALRRGAQQISTLDLLLALLRDGNGMAARVMRRRGITEQGVRHMAASAGD